MLRTKCILAKKSSADGIRFSVMSRHTENDGITPHPGITEETYDYWFHEVAPEDKLVGDYYKRGLSWEEFERRYLAYLREGNRPRLVREIAILALFTDVTLLCIERTPKHCHRRLLAEECKRLVPWLRIDTQKGGVGVEMVIVDGEGSRKLLAIEPLPEFEGHYVLRSHKDFQAAIRELQDADKKRSRIQDILHRLTRSWMQYDPGKYGEDYSFVVLEGAVPGVSIGKPIRVAVRELLPENAIFEGTPQEWRDYRQKAWNTKSLDRVDPSMPVVSFEEVARSNCPQCGTSQPLIRLHVQTEDSPEGDSWKRELLVICCGDIQVLDLKGSDNRIYD